MPQDSTSISSPFVLCCIILFELVELGKFAKLPRTSLQSKAKVLLINLSWGAWLHRSQVIRRTARWRQVPALDNHNHCFLFRAGGREETARARARASMFQETADHSRLFSRRSIPELPLNTQIQFMDAKKFCKRYLT